MTALPSFASIWHTPTADCCATSRTGRPVSACTTTSLLELLGRLRAPAGGMAGGGTPCRCPRRVAAHTACLGRTCRTWCCTCTRAAASRCARETFAFDSRPGGGETTSHSLDLHLRRHIGQRHRGQLLGFLPPRLIRAGIEEVVPPAAEADDRANRSTRPGPQVRQVRGCSAFGRWAGARAVAHGYCLDGRSSHPGGRSEALRTRRRTARKNGDRQCGVCTSAR